jgi:transposase-like protein
MTERSKTRKMARLVAQWRTSGESQAGFARRHGVPPWTLWYWSRKLTDSEPGGPARRAFVPVQVVPEAAPRMAAAIEVVLVSGERLTIPEGVSSDRVRTVLAALRAACRHSRLRSRSTWRRVRLISGGRSMAWPRSCASIFTSTRCQDIGFSSAIGGATE